MLADVDLRLSQIVMPLFVKHGLGVREEVSSMPGVYQMSPDVALAEIERLSPLGIKAFILFGVVTAEQKDSTGSVAVSSDNPVATALKLIKAKKSLDVTLIADLCFCEYTDHGHCGIVSSDVLQTVDNDATNDMLGAQAVYLAECGADVIAPSGAMDGMVGAIRHYLDKDGWQHIPILSYSVKYASNMYGPFRQAAEGAPKFGDRRGYQQDFRRSREWHTEVELDLMEGADMVMVKPAMFYLDVIAHLRSMVNVPVCAYQVSGEYSMLLAAHKNGVLDLESAAMESLIAIRRAGADLIITYFAPSLIEWLSNN
jgi:porphobilinogen synthase